MAYPTTLVSTTKGKVVGNNDSGINGTVSDTTDAVTFDYDLVNTREMQGVAQSSNGRYVVFTSEATNFSAGDTNGARDIFLKDMVTGDLTRVNTTDTGQQIGTGPGFNSLDPDVSDDGRYILFESKGFTAEAGLGNGNSVIYRKDVVTGDLEVVSKSMAGQVVEGTEAKMSADGRYAVFTSSDGVHEQVYLRDMQNDTTTLISVDSDGITAGNDNSTNAYLSSDGKFVVFESEADNFAAGNANPYQEIFLKNIETGELTRVSENALGQGGATGDTVTNSRNAVISDNGRYVVFESNAEDFIPLDKAINTAIYRKDLLTGSIALVSEDKNGVDLVSGSNPSITADGRFVLIKSPNIAAQSTSPTEYNYLYIKDMNTGTLTGIDLARASMKVGAGGFSITTYTPPYESYNATISSDGKYITLSSIQALDKGVITANSFGGTQDNNDGQFDVFRIDVSSITIRNESVSGTAGSDTLDGGAGIDTLTGGLGNDTYIVDLVTVGSGAAASVKIEDVIVEVLNAGTDTLELRGSAVLAKPSTISLLNIANVEVLDASKTGATLLSLTGNALNNRIFGNDAANILDGGVGADELFGGKGNDTYKLDNENDKAIEDSVTGADGIDTLEVNIASVGGAIYLDDTEFFVGIENVTLLNKVAFDIYGNSLDNHLIGNTVVNTILGDDGNDTLDGGAGADTLIGGAGNDVYIVDNLLDEVFEGISADPQNPEIDRVEAKVSYSIENSGEVESLTLLAGVALNATGNQFNNTITGNAGANKLFGLAGEDTLIGGAGNDTLDGDTGADDMEGGVGDDTYYMDDEDDVITESVGTAGGKDTIISSITIEGLTSNVENLTLIGSAANGFGNALANTITGNDGNNELGDEFGAHGNAVDTLIGGKGNDTYHVGMLMSGTGAKTVIRMKDIVNETAVVGSGFDTVKLHGEITQDTLGNAIIVASTITLGINLEGLDIGFTGATLLNINGNSAGNELRGNLAKNVINGLDGDDLLIGDEGNDTLDGGKGNDILEGNSDDDSLTGGAGADELFGGGGNDAYVVNIKVVGTGAGALAQLEDTITEESGTDTLKLSGLASLVSATTFTLDGALADIEHLDASATTTTKLNLTGNTAANILTGNAVANVLTGLAGNDTLIGGAGADTLLGGADDDSLDGGTGNDSLDGGEGNDTYTVDSLADVITDSSGTDTIKSSITYSLHTHPEIEHLALTGTAILNATGNAEANEITGNIAANILDGGAGLDTLIGGKGNDTYIVDSTTDIITELALEGTDTILSSVSYDLTDTDGAGDNGGNIENLILTGTNAINATGNALANKLTGNAGNNILDGAAGIDTLIGGAGDDTYKIDLALTGTGPNVIGALQDTVTESANQGSNDTVELRGGAGITKLSTITLGANLENLDASATGSALLNLTGNTLNNIITGNAAANKIDGGAGNDSLSGNDGNDSLIGGAGNDTLLGGDGIDTLVGGAGNDVYLYDDVSDVIVEVAGSAGGIDTVQTTLTFDLSINPNAVNVENLTLLGSADINGTGNALANYMTGNAGANTLSAGTGNDTLDGGLGADTMIGAAGDDTYIVDNVLDVVNDSVPGALGGIDTVRLVDGYLGGGYLASADIEKVDASTLGFGLNLLGNELANTITGTGFDDGLEGNDGNDTLIGGAGDDELIGGLGADNLQGGAGNDAYQVNLKLVGTLANITVALEDTITEVTGVAGGIDTLLILGGEGATKLTTLTLAATLENLVAASVDSDILLNLTGNTSNNNIIGSNGNNVISGLAGDDILSGGSGDDTLNGGAGTDTLIGGEGNDTYVIDQDAELANITELDNEGVADLLQIAYANTSTINAKVVDLNIASLEQIENLSFASTGTGLFNIVGNFHDNSLTGNASKNNIQGGAGNDILNGGAGADTLAGGADNDSYIVDNPLDVIIELEDEGLDSVQSSVTYTLSANVENLTLTGVTAINGTGNSLANSIQGNIGNNNLSGAAGNDTLDGGAGNDILNGGVGDDSLIGGNGTDTAIFSGNAADYEILLNGGIYTISGFEGIDTLQEIELVKFGSGAAVNISTLVQNEPSASKGIAALDSGESWSMTTIKYSFINSSPTYEASGAHPGFRTMSAYEQNAVNSVLQLYENITNLNFELVADANDASVQLRFGTDDQTAIDTLGYAYYPDTLGLGSFLPSFLTSGDVWINNNSDYKTSLELGDLTPGSTMFSTILHETGHALGLKHPGNYGDGEVPPFLSQAEDTTSLTVMSYYATQHSDIYIENGSTLNYSYTVEPSTLMLYDIAAIQSIYGSNTDFNSGNTTYSFSHNQPILQTIWDGGGIDTINASNNGNFDTRSNIIDLREGHFSSIGMGDNLGITTPNGSLIDFDLTFRLIDYRPIDIANSIGKYGYNGEDNLAIAYGTVIENAIGGLSSDMLIGNASGNELTGNAGNDLLSGSAGDDTLLGGEGLDTLWGGSGSDVFVFDSAISFQNNIDAISDFEIGIDKIYLDMGVYEQLAAGTLEVTAFNSGNFSGAQDVTDRIIYNQETGGLFYDFNGNVGLGPVQFATLQGVTGLSSTDFIVA